MAHLDNEADLVQDSPGTLNCHLFKCQFPGCNASYRRKEHFRRHGLKHLPQQAFSCSICGREFGRSDTLRRHLRQRHKIIDPIDRAQRACESCHKAKSRCEGGTPCDECLRRKIQCSFSNHGSTEEKQISEPFQNRALELTREQSQMHNLEKREQYINFYFEKFHPCWSFIHKGTFDIRHETPLLVQSMVVIGLWARGEQSAQSAAVELHGKLDSAIRDQREKWDASEAEEAYIACDWPIATYQAILLHIIFSFVLSSRGGTDFDLKICLPSADYDLLEALVRSCRRLGMFYYPNILAKYRESDLGSFVWAGIEETKRFNTALYKICGKTSRSSGGDRSQGDTHAVISLLNASELQFPLPGSYALWNAVDKDDWTALAKDEKAISLKDYSQETWISNFAGILQFFEF